jgi:hypothetical protein
LAKSNEQAEKIELEERVVAIVDGEDSGGAVEAVRSGGWEVTTLDSEDEVERLEPEQGGVSGALAKAAAIFGDEMRIIDQIERSLADGNRVVIATVSGDQAPAVTKILREHGALSIWDFRGWTFVNVGSTDEGEEETG